VFVKYWTWFIVFCFVVLSFLVYFVYVWISDNFESFLIFKSAQQIFMSSDYYLIVIFNASLMFVIDYAVMYYRTTYFTSMANYFQFLVKTGKEDQVDAFHYFEQKNEDEDIDYKQPKTPVVVRPVEYKKKDLENQ
jgi:hypothetical protein